MAITKIPAAGFTGNNFRNIIINGDMSIAQRSTSVASITTGGYKTVDRFPLNLDLGTWTQSQSTDVPTGQGFAKSFKMDCTTANASPSAAILAAVRTKIEGQNLQYLKKGTANAESTTLSFWVKSNKTGTYIAELVDNDNSRQISASYTVDVTDTWEKKTITFPGDTSGAFGNDNGASLELHFWLGGGSNYTSGTLNTSWSTNVDADSAVGQVNLADDTSNDFYITGVQLEAGTSASDFEFLPVDVNLQRCLRYYLPLFDGGAGRYIANAFYYSNTQIKIHVEAPVDMRVTPSIEQTVASNCWIMYSNNSGQSFSNSLVMDGDIKTRFFSMYATLGDVSGTAGHAGGFFGVGSGGGFLALSAEL